MEKIARRALFFADEFIAPAAREFAVGLSKIGWKILVSGKVVKDLFSGLRQIEVEDPSIHGIAHADLVCLGLAWPAVVDAAVHLDKREGMTPLEVAVGNVDLGISMAITAILSRTVIVTNPRDYELVLEWIKEGEQRPENFKAGLMAKAFETISQASISLGAQFAALEKALD